MTGADERVTLEAWGAERLALALAERPDVTAALARAVTCEHAATAHDALWQCGQGRTASVLRMVHHGVCGALHDYRIEKPLPWDAPMAAARALAAILTCPGVVERVATAWLSPPSEMRLVLLGLGERDAAARWTAACDAADARWLAQHGYDDDLEEDR